MSPFGASGGQLRFTVPNPTAASMTTLVQGLYDAMAQFPDSTFQITHIGVRYLTDRCDELLQEAVAAAVADGRERAERLAGALGTELGALTKAEESAYFGPTSSDSCSPAIPGSMGGMYGPGIDEAFDPAVPVEATAYANVVLTFAVGQTASATPES